MADAKKEPTKPTEKAPEKVPEKAPEQPAGSAAERASAKAYETIKAWVTSQDDTRDRVLKEMGTDSHIWDLAKFAKATPSFDYTRLLALSEKGRYRPPRDERTEEQKRVLEQEIAALKVKV